ncbi:MAG: CTP synthase [Candidatus Parcubacteria bacterium]|nr:MAG: CTP synthase [Candidatus Parcubacteria bacterium]
MAKRIRKYIFVVGGVMSGVGKGIAASSIGRLLKDSGFKVTAFKIDPYINVDAGTMNPTEHGEVFVLEDGTECDQDMGNYERFLEENFSSKNYMTTGSVYLSVINKERNLEYQGKCVEVVPHIPLEVIQKINNTLDSSKAEIALVEIGGTVGEYQNILFLEAVRILKLKFPKDVLLCLVSYLPLLNKDNELKTKPTQYAVKTLNSAGLQPDIILGRAAFPLDDKRKEKIAFNCNLRKEDVFSAPDVGSIYQVPLNFKKEGVDKVILEKLSLKRRVNLFGRWLKLTRKISSAQKKVSIGIVGKYFSSGAFVLADSYISVIEAVKHAAFELGLKAEISWLDASDFDETYHSSAEVRKNLEQLRIYQGIIVPGGFGSRATEGKIKVIEFARQKKIPFLGLCYGMQLAVVEFTRHLLGLKEANSTEINPATPFPVIDILPEQKEKIREKKFGGTMRLGAWPAVIKEGTIAFRTYLQSKRFLLNSWEKRKLGVKEEQLVIKERHRHRYEVNPDYLEALKKAGLIISGISPSGRLAEIIELPQKAHPFFIGTQFHPELTSWPLDPHPLFKEFIRVSASL